MISIALCMALGVSAPAVARPKPDYIQAAVTEGDALILTAGAQGVFRNDSGRGDGKIMLRHLKSGLTCMFTVGFAENRVLIIPGPPRGDSVACQVMEKDGLQAWTISRSKYSARRQAQAVADVLDLAEAKVIAGDPSARQIARSETIYENGEPGPTFSVFAVGPASAETAITYDEDHHPQVVVDGPVIRIDVAATKDWVVSLYSAGQAETLAARHGGLLFTVRLSNMMDAR